MSKPANTTVFNRNFRWVTKFPTKRKRKRRIAEPLVRKQGENDCINANQYVTQMLAVSMGFKLADAARRVLLYTKPNHTSKGFYAICRGLFPIQELCGTMTALALAKRDLLGFHVPIWRLLAPSVVVHGMANFRGMKVSGKLPRRLHSISYSALCIFHSPYSNGTRQRLGQKCSCPRSMCLMAHLFSSW